MFTSSTFTKISIQILFSVNSCLEVLCKRAALDSANFWKSMWCFLSQPNSRQRYFVERNTSVNGNHPNILVMDQNDRSGRSQTKTEREVEGLQAFTFSIVTVNRNLSKESGRVKSKEGISAELCLKPSLKATGIFVISLSQDGFESDFPGRQSETITS